MMFGLTPYNKRGLRRPSGSVDNFNNFVDSFFKDSFAPFRSLNYDTFKVDIKENEGGYSIEAELPGVKKEEINLDYKDDRLTISLQRDETKEDNMEGYIHRERTFSSMARTIFLKGIEEESIKAKLDNGVLFVEVKKRDEEKKGKTITIE